MFEFVGAPLIGARLRIVARIEVIARRFARYDEIRERSFRGQPIPGFRAKSAQSGLRAHSICLLNLAPYGLSPCETHRPQPETYQFAARSDGSPLHFLAMPRSRSD